MNRADRAPKRRFNWLAFQDLRDALPALVVIATVLVADAALEDDFAFWLVLGGAVAVALGSYVYAESGARGDARRRARERLEATLDPTERTMRRVASLLPLGAGITIGVIAGGGWLDGRVLAATAAIGFLVSQVIFVLWLNARHSHRDPRG
jgi:hypothetical protein